MKEILGNDLKRYFAHIAGACLMYKGRKYEVWQITDHVLDRMRDESLGEFVEEAGEEAWWRYAVGCSLPTPSRRTRVKVNGELMVGFDDHFRLRDFSCLTEYLCDEIGASTERNVCACSVELARANGMKLWELWTTYQGDK